MIAQNGPGTAAAAEITLKPDEGTDPAAALEQLLGQEYGWQILVFLVLLAVSVLGFTVLALRVMARATPRVGLPRPRWGGPEVLLAFAMWFVIQNVAVVAASLVVATVRASTHPATLLALDAAGSTLDLTIQLGALAAGGLVFAGGLLLIPRIVDQPMTVLGIGSGSIPRGVGAAVVVGLTIIPATFIVAALWQLLLHAVGYTPEPQDVVGRFMEAVGRGEAGMIGTIAFLTVIVAPITEELLFRAVLFRWLSHRTTPRRAIVISGVIFGAVHLSVSALLPLVLLGMLLAAVLHRTGNLWACIALHALFNGTNLALMALGAALSSGA